MSTIKNGHYKVVRLSNDTTAVYHHMKGFIFRKWILIRVFRNDFIGAVKYMNELAEKRG